jgi:DNA-binding transcriptional LysR family regulator
MRQELARVGMGTLLQPAELGEPELAAGRLVRLLPRYHPSHLPLHLLYAPARQMTPKLRSFIEFAVAAFGAREA